MFASMVMTMEASSVTARAIDLALRARSRQARSCAMRPSGDTPKIKKFLFGSLAGSVRSSS